MPEDKDILTAIKRLESMNIDASILKDDRFDNEQKGVIYRGLRRHQNIETLKDPTIPASDMENILEDERDMQITLQKDHGLIPQKYKIAQLYELKEALNKGFDISHYKSPEFSATHMYLARTYQENNFPLDNITPQTPIPSIIARHTELINEANDRKIKTDLAAYSPKYDQQFDKLLHVTDELNYICTNSERPLNVSHEIRGCLEQYRSDLLATGLSPEFVDSLEKLALSPANYQSNILYPPFAHITPDNSPERLDVMREIYQYEHTTNGPFLPRDYTNEQLSVLEKQHHNLPYSIFQISPEEASPRVFELFLNEKHNIDNLTSEYVLISPISYYHNDWKPMDISTPPCQYIEFNTVDDVMEIMKYYENPNNPICSKLQEQKYFELSTGETIHITDNPAKIGQSLLNEIFDYNGQALSERHEILPVAQLEQSKTYSQQLEYKELITNSLNQKIDGLITCYELSTYPQGTTALINWDKGEVRTLPSAQKALEIKSPHEDLVQVTTASLEKYAAQKFHARGKEFQKTQSPRIDEGLSLL